MLKRASRISVPDRKLSAHNVFVRTRSVLARSAAEMRFARVRSGQRILWTQPFGPDAERFQRDLLVKRVLCASAPDKDIP